MSWSKCPECGMMLNNWYPTHKCPPPYSTTTTGMGIWDRKPSTHVCICEICKKVMRNE